MSKPLRNESEVIARVFELQDKCFKAAKAFEAEGLYHTNVPSLTADCLQDELELEAWLATVELKASRAGINLSNPPQSSSATESLAGKAVSSTGAGSFRNGVPMQDKSIYEQSYARDAAEAKALEDAMTALGHTNPERPGWDVKTQPEVAASAMRNHLDTMKTLANCSGVNVDAVLMTARGGLTEKALKANESKNAPPPARDKSLSWTWQVLAAKGAKSLEDLEVKGRFKKFGSAIKGTAIIAALLCFLGAACAQSLPSYSLTDPSTYTIAAASTNSPLFQNVSEFQSFGLQAILRGHSGTPSNVQFYVYRSIDTTYYESEPFTNCQVRLSGTGTNIGFFALDVRGVASLRIVPANTNAAVITNLQLTARFNRLKTTSP